MRGCRLELAGGDKARIKAAAPDEVVRCEECRRIIVRTEESACEVATRVVIEADGGSRGNPGPAGYGAVVRDAATGEVLAERSGRSGITTNNVAEYQGLIAGLRAAADLGRDEVEVRMDSELVVEQMSGRWQIKHPGLRPLAAQAAALVGRFDAVRSVDPAGAQQARRRAGERGHGRGAACAEALRLLPPVADRAAPGRGRRPAGPGRARAVAARARPRDRDRRGGGGRTGVLGRRAPPRRTRLVLVRHGETDHTVAAALLRPRRR